MKIHVCYMTYDGNYTTVSVNGKQTDKAHVKVYADVAPLEYTDDLFLRLEIDLEVDDEIIENGMYR